MIKFILLGWICLFTAACSVTKLSAPPVGSINSESNYPGQDQEVPDNGDNNDDDDVEPGPCAQGLVIEWTIPTQRENGEALGQLEIEQFEFHGYHNGSETREKIITVPWKKVIPEKRTSVEATIPKEGDWVFSGFTVDTNGLYSNEAMFQQGLVKVCAGAMIRVNITM